MTSERPETPSACSSDDFTADDLDLLSSAVTLVPQLLLATRFAKLARQQLTFPLQAKSEIGPLFSDGDVLVVGDEKFSRTVIERFLPDELFPVETLEASVGVALAAICWSAAVHRMESFVSAQTTGSAPCPSPGV